MESLMYKPMMLFLASLTFLTLQGAVSGGESSRADFTDYARVMDGEWVGRVSLWEDIPEIGKKANSSQCAG